VKNLVSPRRAKAEVDSFRIAVINMISLRRLIDGGAAIFLAVNKNHHSVRVGVRTIRPFIRNKLRVCISS
jgi:hypothetical protein